MKVLPLLGILAILYAGMVVVIALKKPVKIWNMKKIEMFKNMLGEKGTVVFFYIWGVVFLVLGIWLLMK
ncbi:MAG: hypothetical protein ACOWWH_11675 [Eubacteriaceae bacterium]